MSVEPSVVVIEPERELLDTVCFHFKLDGCQCVGVTSTDDAVRCLSDRPIDLVVVDFGAIGRSSRDLPVLFAKVLPYRTPVILLADRKDDPHVLMALERYADDFVTKPLSLRELLARGRALIRRTSNHPGRMPSVVTNGSLTLDPKRRRVAIDGADVKMSDQEFRLLYMLVSHPGVVFSRKDILEIIWRGDTEVTTRSVDALVKRVRRRVESVRPEGVPLLNVRGVGYKFSGVDSRHG